MTRHASPWAWALFIVSGLLTQRLTAQEERPDFRIRADFRDESHESVGHAEFRIKSRFLQVYYGGVSRKDEYRFGVELESPNFANREFDILINDYFLGSLAADPTGFAEVNYLSRFHADDAPDRPLPADFPEQVQVGDIIRIRDHLTAGVLLTGALEEEYERGDADLDGKVNKDDYEILVAHYGQRGVGPSAGDFSGDNVSNHDDYLLLVDHWTDSKSPPGAPQLPGDYDHDHAWDIDDLDEMTAKLRSGSDDRNYDVDGDGHFSSNDRQAWIEQLKYTYYGDANLDGQFDSTDFVEVFQRGQYEDGIEHNSTWRSGDWNGDGDFDSGDFVEAFATGSFERGARAAVQAVPEPASGALLLCVGLASIGTLRRSRHTLS